MLYLTFPTQDILNTYFLKVKDSIIQNINDNRKNAFLNLEAKSFLINELENIIKANPLELKQLNVEFFQKLNKGILKYKHYLSYIQYIDAESKDLTLFQKTFLFFYRRQLRKIENIFDYEEILSKSKSKSYWLAKQINTNTCIYCNRLYAKSRYTSG